MKVFISSVRQGLEAERDALPGLVKAIGHEPIAFEQFTAQAVPSRQACMDGVDAADVYVLLLGEFYGHTFPETGQSATRDEYERARQRGIPRLVFVKAGVEMEPEQRALADAIGDYGTGSFWATFEGVGELQTQVADALRELSARPGQLDYQSLTDPVQFVWLSDWPDHRAGVREGGVVELHVAPLSPAVVSGRLMRAMPDRLIGALRASGSVPAHAGLDPKVDAGGAAVDVPLGARGSMGTVAPGALRSVRVTPTGQVSVSWSLPSDGMGGMLQLDDLAEACTRALRLAGSVAISDAGRYVVAIGVTGSLLTVVDGSLPSSSRTSTSFGVLGDRPIRVVPDESVPAAAFDNGADEFGRELATALVATFQSG
ncbi:DUF4062 domain-containing protein [Knoellia aerolata]|uniref:DUF4062 domain-containing protein n=1 Tax=Knoellia aerolata DSM 18566 TaxID=1385519 RepID=A0A0A0JUK8_9MICO|nr:DUF4062 domain-containing protein [Knoellia aerolata]KGN41030.1 hypothetical protein N801_09715 [Knoellia aerolata DSM 18566]